MTGAGIPLALGWRSRRGLAGAQLAWWSPADSIVMAPESSWRGSDAERVLLIPSTHVSIRKRVAWHQRPCAGCVVLALFSLFGLACVSLPSFESPANITVFRASDADVRVRDAAGWREELSDPPSDARHAVTLAVRQDRAAILAALKQVSDPDSPKYGQHLTREEVAELSTPRRSIDFVRAYLDKATNALSVRVSWSPGLDFVRVEGRVEDLDRIFNARFADGNARSEDASCTPPIARGRWPSRRSSRRTSTESSAHFTFRPVSCSTTRWARGGRRRRRGRRRGSGRGAGGGG